MTKKWVFNILVKNDKDHEGLIAYALYKYDKYLKAKQVRAETNNEPEVDKAVKEFHDSVVSTVSFQKAYQDAALTFLVNVSKNVTEPLIRKHTEEISALKAEHKKELLNFEKDWIKKVRQQVASKPFSIENIKSQIASNIVSLLITAIFSFVIIAVVLVNKVSEDDQKRYLKEFADDAINTIVSKPNISDTKDTNLQPKNNNEKAAE